MFRLILGLEKPDSGVILFGTSAGDTGNNDIKHLPAWYQNLILAGSGECVP